MRRQGRKYDTVICTFIFVRCTHVHIYMYNRHYRISRSLPYLHLMYTAHARRQNQHRTCVCYAKGNSTAIFLAQFSRECAFVAFRRAPGRGGPGAYRRRDARRTRTRLPSWLKNFSPSQGPIHIWNGAWKLKIAHAYWEKRRKKSVDLLAKNRSTCMHDTACRTAQRMRRGKHAHILTCTGMCTCMLEKVLFSQQSIKVLDVLINVQSENYTSEQRNLFENSLQLEVSQLVSIMRQVTTEDYQRIKYEHCQHQRAKSKNGKFRKNSTIIERSHLLDLDLRYWRAVSRIEAVPTVAIDVLFLLFLPLAFPYI